MVPTVSVSPTTSKGEGDLAEQVTVLLKPRSSSELVEAEKLRPDSKETATATAPFSFSARFSTSAFPPSRRKARELGFTRRQAASLRAEHSARFASTSASSLTTPSHAKTAVAESVDMDTVGTPIDASVQEARFGSA